MLKHRNEQIQFTVRMTDVFIGFAAFFLAYQLRGAEYVGPIESVSWMLVSSLVIHFITYSTFGFYQSLRLKTMIDIISMILKAMVTDFFVLGTLVFLFQAKSTSRFFFGLFLLINYGLLLFEKLGARVLLSNIRKRGYNYRQVLVLGTGRNSKRVLDVLKKNKHWGYVPFGILKEPDQTMASIHYEEIPILGSFNDLEKVVSQRAVDEVYFASDTIHSEEVLNQVSLCEKLGIPARFALGHFDHLGSKVTFNTLDRLPVVTFYTTLRTPLEAFLKRVMDIAIACVGLCLTAILFPWIAWKIKRESPGSVIFKQIRVGENGRRFKCYKFRTMYADAESKKIELASANTMQGPIFKVSNDPRVTHFGAFLRQTSLDEFPQFFNILRGDMSVVGTRPPTPDEVSQYETHYRRRLSIRPGLTGLWQVSGRSQIKNFEDILALDLKYIDQWSIVLDIKIIFQTAWVIFFRRGAY